MLSDRSIATALAEGELAIAPYDNARLQPCSYDVTLGTSFVVMSDFANPLDPYEAPRNGDLIKLITSEYCLKPGAFVLACTCEDIALGAQLAARVEGKSSLARLGLLVHTAGFVDAGFAGTLTLEITNLGQRPILLKANMPIAQLCFFRLDRPAGTTYRGKYQGQTGATESRFYQNRLPR